LRERQFGSWSHKEQGVGVLKRAGIVEDSVKSFTLIHMQGSDKLVVFLRLTKAPDQNQVVQGLGASSTKAGGSPCYEVKLLSATPLHHVAFIEPTLFVFSQDPKLILLAAEARKTPAVSPDLLQAIRLTRGCLARAALAARGGFDGISLKVAAFFWTFTRAPGSFFELCATAKALAYWYAPTERGFQTHFACRYGGEAAAVQAEEKANEVIRQIRRAYETDRQATVQELRGATIRMFEQVACLWRGDLVTLSWPFDAEFVHHYWGQR
jgi:hypothetical protein